MIETTLDIPAIRADFPFLQQGDGQPVAFLDSGASAQKPRQMLAAMDGFYRSSYANVHRGVYALSEAATAAYEAARATVAGFIGASSPREVVFVRNTTEAINLVAQSWGAAYLKPGDKVLLTVMEHHANIVPWQLVAERTGALLDYLPIDGDGRLVLDDLDQRLDGVKLVALTHQSNVLGTVNPVAQIASRAHAHGALVLLDAAQSVPHMPVDVQALGVDFLAFSGHKALGPSGVGALWGRRALLQAMPPFLGGGSMIRTVTLERSTYADVPQRFEAGTPAIAEAVGLAAALDYLSGLGMEQVQQHIHTLTGYALERLKTVPGLRVYGPPTAAGRGGAVSFTLDSVHPHDVAQLLDEVGVAVRAGHHCCQPLHALLDVPATTRASFAAYSTAEEVDRLVDGLLRAQRVFQ